eukprot:8055537-Prorocentrum_lima.AAC.1
MEYWWVGCEDSISVCTTGSCSRLGHPCPTTLLAREIGSSPTRCPVDVEEIFVWLDIRSKNMEYHQI